MRRPRLWESGQCLCLDWDILPMLLFYGLLFHLLCPCLVLRIYYLGRHLLVCKLCLEFLYCGVVV